MALVMKPHCEKCEATLAYDGLAYICSYECTFCKVCSKDFDYRCPNCGGELVARPKRRVDPEPPLVA